MSCVSFALCVCVCVALLAGCTITLIRVQTTKETDGRAKEDDLDRGYRIREDRPRLRCGSVKGGTHSLTRLSQDAWCAFGLEFQKSGTWWW